MYVYHKRTYTLQLTTLNTFPNHVSCEQYLKVLFQPFLDNIVDKKLHTNYTLSRGKSIIQFVGELGALGGIVFIWAHKMDQTKLSIQLTVDSLL